VTSRADLFVVCKQCGSEVSAFITECPYCGNRLRRRAPKLPRERQPRTRRPNAPSATLGRLRRGEIPGIRADSPPYATAALVVATCGVWIAWRGAYVNFLNIDIAGPLHGDWWRLITAQFAYLSGIYQFVALLTIGVFGWLMERRCGPIAVIALFFAAGVAGALATLALYPHTAVVTGANGPALALVAAWAAPDLQALRNRTAYDGDLLGAAAFAIAILLMPAARQEVSWIAGLVGGAIGLLAGPGLARIGSR
jgi:membrane associated rhomboid family serine protease